MLRFYSQFPFSDKDNSFWLPDLMNTSGVFIKRVESSLRQPINIFVPKGMPASLIPESLRFKNFAFQECEYNKTNIWSEDFFNAFPQFVAGLNLKSFLLGQQKEQILRHWFEYYFYSLEITNGTLENLISLSLKIQSDLYQGGEETISLLERLKWDFSNLLILARDTGGYESSIDYWKLNPTLQIIHNQHWEDKKGIYSLWADQKLMIHEELISNEEIQVFQLFEEGMGLNKFQHADPLFQNLHHREILL